MTPLTPIEFRGLSAYCAGLCEADHLIYCSIVGSDSMARGIASAIVEKPTMELEYTNDAGRIRYALPKQPDGKYLMDFVKLADNAINAQVYLESLLPGHAKPDEVTYLLRRVNDTTDQVETKAVAYDAIWSHLNSLNTPLLPDWKDTVCHAICDNYRNGENAWADGKNATLGNFIMLRIHAPEHKLDAMITDLIRTRKISF